MLLVGGSGHGLRLFLILFESMSRAICFSNPSVFELICGAAVAGIVTVGGVALMSITTVCQGQGNG